MPAPVSPVFPAAAADDPRDRFHVVLVEPEKSINIGAVARAMTNLGFRHLHLVAPRHFERERAAVSARASAEPLLDAAVIHATLEEAVADAEEVVGLALRAPGKDPAHFVTLPQWAARLPAGRAASA
ncbi:MAG TPA: TrmH family RNA methyltransferase, partial [Armatimonadaceae bacterium]|nr:TrmH family RNA methyltransferase [Armatimonadaceae bacterium]